MAFGVNPGLGLGGSALDLGGRRVIEGQPSEFAAPFELCVFVPLSREKEGQVNSRGPSAFVVFTLIFFPSIAFASCLEEAAGFAERMCGEISSRGSSQLISGSGELNVKAKGLIARMLGSAQGDAKVDAAITSYENVTREQLASEHANARDCNIRMAEVAITQVCPQAPVKKDRSKIIQSLEQYYASGSAITQTLLARNITDAQIDELANAGNKWYNDTINWIRDNMTEGAVAKFMSMSDKLSFSYELDGTHTAEEKKKREDTLNGLNGRLTNLEALINTDVWDVR